MRVLHVVTAHTPNNAFGGPMRVAINLCSGLAARGHDVKIASLSLGFEPPLPTTLDGVPARLFRGLRVLPIGGFSGLSSPSLLRWAHDAVGDYDVVHAHLARDLVTLPVARLAQRAGVPTVLQTHGMVDHSDKRIARLLDAVLTRRVLTSASGVLHLTDFERLALNEVVTLAPQRVHRLPNGVPDQGPFVRAVGRPTVLFLGRLHPRKRPEDVVRVAELLRAQSTDVEMVIAGPDEGALSSTLELISRHGLQDRVTYVGGVDHERALELMRHASVFLLPSIDEPFPMSVLEAMSVGLPVVLTTSNGLAGDVRQTGAGRVVEPDVAALAKAVADLLVPATNSAASAAAYEAVRSRFGMARIVDQLEVVYRAAVEERSNSR